ncbi:MAG: TIGR02206 family membrane protein [Bacillota bacterium]
MDKFLSVNSINELKIFSMEHILALAIIIIVCILIFICRQRLKKEKENKTFRYIWVCFSILPLVSFQAWTIGVSTWSLNYSLPLQLCDMALILSAVMMINKNNNVFEVVYIWGMGGAFQALLTPDLFYSFPHFMFFKFFIAHGIVIVVISFMVFVEGCRPQPGALKRVFMFTNAYALAIAAFNIFTRSNYLFLCQKPNMPSIFDLMGPWPWYLLSLEVVLIASFFLYNLPFYVYSRLLLSGEAVMNTTPEVGSNRP